MPHRNSLRQETTRTCAGGVAPPHQPLPTTAISAGARRPRHTREGKILVLVAVLLPVLLALVGLVLDSGLLMGEYRAAQHAADAAATAAARRLLIGDTKPQATTTAVDLVKQRYSLKKTGGVNVRIPPAGGPHAGMPRYVEVEIVQPVTTHFVSFLGGGGDQTVRTRAVAAVKPATAGAVLVVLDPDPPKLSVPAVGALLPPLPALIAGLEVLGVGQLRVDGAILVNTEWGGVDEDGRPAGTAPAPPMGIGCLGLAAPDNLQARDIRVVGGVDDPDNYGPFVGGDLNPLTAGRLPVPDPLANLPVPTMAVDPVYVSDTPRGTVQHVGLPLLPPLVLNPGVYDWIQIVSGRVRFNPGVYVIRGANPLTGIALNILAGEVVADDVMFYITDSGGYSAATGLPDTADGAAPPAAPGVLSLVPSVVINAALPGSRFTGLSDPASPFDGMLIFQRRHDRRPVVIARPALLNNQPVRGTIYARWGHVILTGSGNFETSVVAGTLRVLTILPMTIAPADLLPPAEDVYLVE